MKPEIKSLAVEVVRHLEREEEVLRALDVMTQRMRDSLQTRDVAIDDLLLRHSDLSNRLELITDERSRLRKRLANVFAVPEHRATLSLLVEHSDPTTSGLLQEFQTRLQASASSLSGVLASNGSLALRMLDIFDRVFRTLSGDRGSNHVYESSGRRRVA